MTSTTIFEFRESHVRSYSQTWPTVFTSARGSWLRDEGGRDFLDFFAGAGALNYGHNNPELKRPLLDYMARDGLVHGLDQATTAKRDFLIAIDEILLAPRGLDYKVQFPGPTGTNAVEAALKLARKVTGRTSVLSFTNGFHGMTLGALAITGNAKKRHAGGVPLGHSTSVPYDGFLGAAAADLSWLERMLDDSGSGMDTPAAFIVETVQGEGGLNAARHAWLRELAELCRRRAILLIVDDVQMGCGRTGPFFSFEAAGITPDIVCMSKSISGYGLPLALTLFRRDLDVWSPGEHNGTFRGNNPAFVTGTAALHHFWKDGELQSSTMDSGEYVSRHLADIAARHPGITVKGRGLAQGIAFDIPERAGQVCAAAFDRGLLMETSGPRSEVVKLLPPLTITREELDHGLDIFTRAVEDVHDRARASAGSSDVPSHFAAPATS